jgi:hypothetical protein
VAVWNDQTQQPSASHFLFRPEGTTESRQQMKQLKIGKTWWRKEYNPRIRIGTKEQWAAHWQASPRWVEVQISRGLPVIRTSHQRLRINFRQADEWMIRRYGEQRIAPSLKEVA